MAFAHSFFIFSGKEEIMFYLKPTDMFQGVSFQELAQQFGTPLYLYDEQMIRSQCQTFLSNFVHPFVRSEVIYASKAFLTKAMATLIHQEGFSLDVVSGGELYTAVQAKFPVNRLYFHGNNKSKKELLEAIEAHVGTIIIDSEAEFLLLQSILPTNTIQRVMLRINPGIEAHTHEYIQTTKNDSKFGESIFADSTMSLISRISKDSRFDFVGLHSHIGSQIFEESSFYEHSRAVLQYIKAITVQTKVVVKEINLGGGFGVVYTSADQGIDLIEVLPKMLDTIYQVAMDLEIAIPKVLIEPGRAIVAQAGSTLYEVGSTKQTVEGKNYLMVDGSMADHIRTALYQAIYDAVLISDREISSNSVYTVAGKACESGDVLIRSIQLPQAQAGDYLLVKTTGAYHYSMASNYNRLTKPAVVFVNNGVCRVVVKKETYADLIRLDVDMEE
jgi:diaminopimelate decarboxylase